jgi:integrase
VRAEPASQLPHRPGRQAVRWDLMHGPDRRHGGLAPAETSPDIPAERIEVRLFLTEFCHVGLGPALALVVGAGLRPPEICGFRWDDVNFEAGMVWPKRNVVPRSIRDGRGGCR